MRTKSKVVPQRGKVNKAFSDTGSRPKRALKSPYFSEVWYIADIAVVSLRWLPEAVWLSHHNEKDIHWHIFYFLGSGFLASCHEPAKVYTLFRKGHSLDEGFRCLLLLCNYLQMQAFQVENKFLNPVCN